ncbi:MAG: 2,3-bisphosphoglycerate-independent phosphoglycerate mutase [Flavobacteriales bacterium]|nr:2,3-bisphosphoglycerate-independent phosphoglycerate mutase [Flavobacteriales bacterium]
MSSGRVVLIIMDGWGLGAGDSTDAITQANTPFIDSLGRNALMAQLLTDGEHVGLPAGQMGNSEVGHLNIGAGRVVFQDLVRIDRAIADGSLEQEPELQAAFTIAKANGRKLHLIGLLSDGGVHSMRTHAEALCRMATRAGLTEVYLHAFTDGRDADPRSGKSYMERFLAVISNTPVRVASVIGRYYAMDRDKRWERVQQAYDLLVRGRGESVSDPLQAFDRSYAEGKTDEFIAPHLVVDESGAPLATIQPGDVVICFNFRTDRCREITQALTQRAFPEQGMEPLPLHYVTMTEYDQTYTDVHVLFRKDDLPMTMGEVVTRAGRKQVRIAETEKYPHVTFFFNGGREAPFTGEERIMLPSPKVATYDLQPEMSAQGIVDAIVPIIEGKATDLVVLNFANPDMVGHTGVFDAIVRAVETTDRCTQRVAEAARANDYAVVIIADHGNADKARNADGSPNTAHSLNPVPIFVLGEGIRSIRNGVLADVAPTVLDLMGMEKPVEMTGFSLIVR